jgi:diguanylate cyclase (GGDEF)-like protein
VQADGFEAIVRKFGRKASKQLLVKLADMLSRQIGNAGIACRIKAHRFGVLIYSGDQDEASSYLQRFRRSVEEARCVLKGESFFLTVSAGVVTLDRETQDFDAAMSLAETALLAAAGAGGNRVEVVPEATAAAEPEIVSAGETNISELIEQGRLFLRAQRIHPLKLPTIHTYHEILLGVRGPDGATLPPGPVVATAERRGQVGELDRWVIREALTWMMAAPERLAHAAGYSLNLSGVTLSDEKLIHDILELLSSTRVPPGKVTFEITETAGIDSLPTARNFLNALQDQGCKFSLDDFGVGHASFAYLRSLPVDKIKIDGMFIKDLALNPNDRAVVQSITEVAHFMGRHTVAEFVENDEILGIVREIGVDYVQGYGIEKPRAIDELILPPPPLALFEAEP